MSSLLRLVRLLVGLGCLSGCLRLQAAPLRFASVTLKEGGPAATLDVLWCPGVTARHPVILMLGALAPEAAEPRPALGPEA